MLGNDMIDRLKALVLGNGGAQRPHRRDDLPLAATALLVEAALTDGHMDADERRTIADLVGRRFELSADDARALVEAAEETVAATEQILPFTRVVKDRFEAAERVEMMEMLWEVVYADGRLHDYEANLVRRIAGLIYVPDQDSGAARKRALARLGVDTGG